jgi:serine/threonine-protein kinase RsbW
MKLNLKLESSYEALELIEGLLNELQVVLNFDDDFYARLMLSVSEAATNAIVHGNKLNPSKKVTIHAEANTQTLTFTIKDEGDGFNPDNIPNPLEEEHLLIPSGRGVFLIKEYADELEYQDEGRTIVIKFNL